MLVVGMLVFSLLLEFELSTFNFLTPSNLLAQSSELYLFLHIFYLFITSNG